MTDLSKIAVAAAMQGLTGTIPRWRAWGHPEDMPPINPMVGPLGYAPASDTPSTPECPGPSLAALGGQGAIRIQTKPPRHHAVAIPAEPSA